MPINPEEMEYLIKKNKRGVKISDFSLEEARTYFTRSMRENSTKREVYCIIEKEISIEGRRIRVRIYQPSDATNKPIMLFCHGGGFVMGDLESYDFDCRNLSTEIDCVIVSVEYRLAPEYKYPAAINDCYSVAKWILNNSEYDPLRDEGELFSQILKSAGVNVLHKRFEGTIHGFMSMPALLKTAHDGYAFISKITAKTFHS